MGGLGAPMGWWNNEGIGQPGILGGLLKVGKGTMKGKRWGLCSNGEILRNSSISEHEKAAQNVFFDSKKLLFTEIRVNL